MRSGAMSFAVKNHHFDSAKRNETGFLKVASG
jgi:hypothetical protein